MSLLLSKIPPARALSDQQTTQASVTVGFADLGAPVLVGVIPAGCVILSPVTGAQVNEVFNAVTTNTIDLGDGTTDNVFGSVISTALGFVAVSEASAAYKTSAPTEVWATVKETGGTLTTGSADIVVNWVQLPA